MCRMMRHEPETKDRETPVLYLSSVVHADPQSASSPEDLFDICVSSRA